MLPYHTSGWENVLQIVGAAFPPSIETARREIRRAVQVVPCLTFLSPADISYRLVSADPPSANPKVLLLGVKRARALKLDRIHPSRISPREEFGSSPVAIL